MCGHRDDRAGHRCDDGHFQRDERSAAASTAVSSIRGSLYAANEDHDRTSNEWAGCTGGNERFLAAIGVYGVIAYAIAQRIREVAIRLALGATSAEVFWLTFIRAQRIAVAGVVGGLALAYPAGRVLASTLYEVRAADPLISRVGSRARRRCRRARDGVTGTARCANRSDRCVEGRVTINES